MSTAMMIAVLAIASVTVVFGVRFLLNRRRGPAQMPLTVKGFGTVGYDKAVMSRAEAERIALDLASIHAKVITKLAHIYGEQHECAVVRLKLDTNYHKPAEWTGIHARHMTVNPARPKHRSHFAEEINNLFRVEMYGFPFRYSPMDDDDERKREIAQEFCRGF